jgi:hypothetical protein
VLWPFGCKGHTHLHISLIGTTDSCHFPPPHQTPFTMWMMALLVIYGVSYDKLSGLEGPLVSLSMAQRVVTGSSRLRMWAQALVYAETPADKALARQ